MNADKTEFEDHIAHPYGVDAQDASRTVDYLQGEFFIQSRHIDLEELDIDEALRKTGQCGRFQILVMAIMMAVVYVTTFPALLFYFIGHSPPWHCRPSNSSTSLWHSLSSNVSGNDMSKFEHVVNNSLTNETVSTDLSKFCDFKENIGKTYESNNKARCYMSRDKWMFSANKSTLVTEFDLVCGKTSEDALIGSAVFIGWSIGSIFLGILSDHYGRKNTMFICLLGLLICSLFQAFVSTVWQVIALRFLLGVFVSCTDLNAFVILAEVTGPERRVLLTTIGGSSWTIGLFVMTLKAYLIDSWRTLVIVSAAPYFFIMGFWFFTPESIRWLNAVGRTADAEKILQKVARVNKQPDFNFTLKNTESEKKKSSYVDLFKNWIVCKLVLVQGYLWLNCGLSYYGMSLAADGFGGSIYVNFVLSVAVELPAGILQMYLLQRFGRKKTAIGSFLLVGVSCIALAGVYMTNGSTGVKVSLGTFAKFVSTISFGAMYIWSVEIYPTVVRSQGMGICIVTSHLGAGISPFVVTSLKQISSTLPFVVIGAGSLVAGFLCFVLPETFGKPTRECLEDLQGLREYRHLEEIAVDGIPLQERVLTYSKRALSEDGDDVDLANCNGDGDREVDVLLTHLKV